MKEYLKNNSRLLTICITLFAIAIAGFSFAYASEENQLYTRDELSNLVSELKEKEDSRFTVYETSTIVNASIPNNGYAIGCELSLTDPGNYLLFGNVYSVFTPITGEFNCQFNNTNINEWGPHDNFNNGSSKFCETTSFVTISEAKTIKLNLYQSSSATTQPVTRCSIKAVKI